jgi:CheY-like chemotaxis protein
MVTRSAVPLVDALADEIAGAESTASPSVRSNAAFVRSLVDEVAHRKPSDPCVAGLHEQIGEELARLATALGAPAQADATLDVLVVDDEEASRVAMASVLKHLGHPYRIVASAEEAIAEYARKPAAIVLSDWHMPGMSGLELCATLKQKSPLSYVILATAHGENAHVLEGARVGVDDFMEKPLDVDELALRLRGAARLVHAVRSIVALKERLPAPSTPRST